MHSGASAIKRLFVPPGRKPRRIKGGPFRGISMELDLTCDAQLYAGLFEREIARWLNTLSAGIHGAIDVGAGKGEYTLYFLSKTTAGKIVAFEPDEASRECLSGNLRLNGFDGTDRLHVSESFVGCGPDEFDLGRLVDAAMLPCLVKVDVDGKETDVIRGASGLLDCPDTRWIVETHSPTLEHECIELLEGAGFGVTIVPQARWRRLIPELRPSSHNRWLVATRSQDALLLRGSGR